MPGLNTCAAPDCHEPIPPGSRRDRRTCSLRCQTYVRRHRDDAPAPEPRQ